MIEEEFSKEELDIIGNVVKGSFFRYENDCLIYSSHTYPEHRISVFSESARAYINEIIKGIIDNSKAD